MKHENKKIFPIYMALILLFFGTTVHAAGIQESVQTTQEATTEETVQVAQEEQHTEVVPVTELDLGDYLTEMTVGEKQLLTVTILPANANSQTLGYASSNTEVATMNSMGRIIAIKAGTTKITVTCGTVSASFDLTVKEAEDTDVKVTELDLGDCPTELAIGTSQILSVAVIPANATNFTIQYKSGNPDVAAVNALGRLTAKQFGTAEITVSCGKVKGRFEVTVVKDSTKEENVDVQDVEIGNYEKELKVDSTLNISATVLPSDATEPAITYKSSNPQIATVNSSGEVKGIAPGEVVIFVSAGKITKQVPVTVKIATTSIQLNSDYQVMKPGDTFQMKAKVQPEDAAGALTYKSMNPEVASVSATGLITAKACGDTAIVASNGDLQVSVTVIVNEEGNAVQIVDGNLTKNGSGGESFPDEVLVEEYAIIPEEMLKYFYEKEKVLTIKGDGYIIYLDGKNIVNFENELHTELLFQEEESGFSFVVNEEQKLCGKLTIDMTEKITEEKYLYLYHTEKDKYQKLKTEELSLLNIDTAGKYLVTSKPLSSFRVHVILIVAGGLVLLIGVGIYIVVKKKYWFW